MRFLAVFAFSILALSMASAGEPAKDNPMSAINMKYNNQELTVNLNDSQASRDFMAMLPLDLTLRDYNSTEKVGDLPLPLSTAGSPASCTPNAGTFAYYVPWGNLAIFYRDFHQSSGLIPLGSIPDGIEKLAAMQGEFPVRFEVK